jgi:hypothetical protein
LVISFARRFMRARGAGGGAGPKIPPSTARLSAAHAQTAVQDVAEQHPAREGRIRAAETCQAICVFGSATIAPLGALVSGAFFAAGAGTASGFVVGLVIGRMCLSRRGQIYAADLYIRRIRAITSAGRGKSAKIAVFRRIIAVPNEKGGTLQGAAPSF